MASTTESVKFTWTIDNFSKLDNTEIYSEIFVVGGYKWWMSTFPKADNGEHLSLYLEVADTAALPKGWSKEAHFSLAVVDQIHNKYSIRKDAQHKFNASSYYQRFAPFMTLSDLSDPSRGCLVNDTVVLEAEVAVHKVLGYWSYDSKKETGYVGLKKQGATFYINSLLQTLYHIPYFRKAVYHMPITENDMPIGNIPLALQSLFYELQYNDTSVATKDFTKSFGWDIYYSFIPHDMQELNRVLCEKLEDKMKGTVVEGTIRQLFEGHHMTYTEFINVDCKSMRKESFYGLQLDVKGCRDVYDSFDEYVKIERLEGDKKYLAEEHGLQDAKKGILFINFPPVLQLQLKRFEYDFTQDTVVKINDRFEFPLQLDLDRDNGMYLSPEADRSVRNLYTLHSVLVHSGGVLGGHYYAFIRPTLSDQWFKFNDERVTKEDMKRALEEQYGGEEELPQNNPGCNDTPFQFSTYSNAYMLVYIRETDKDKIICNVDEDIAEHLRIRLKKERDEKEDRRRYKVQAHLYTIIKVARDEDLTQQIGRDIYFDLVDHDKVRSFRIQKQSPFSLFKEEVAKEFGIPVQFQRFWIWEKRQNHTYRPNRPLTAQEEAQSVGQLREMSNKTHNAELKLFLEVEFGPDLHPIPPPEKSKEDIVLFFKLYDPEKEELRYVGRLSVKSSSQPIEILAKLNQMAGFAPDEEIELYEEIKFQPFVMCAHLDNGFTFQASQIEDGDIICFQKAPPLDSEEESRYPDVPSFLKYVYNRQIVHFRSLEKPKEDDFCLELSKLHSYDEVVERVALQLGLDDPSKIRLTSHSCYSQQPKPQPINFRGVKHLSDMLVHYYQMSDILYYEVLDITLPELQGLKQATACMRQYQKNNDVPTIVDEEDDTTIPPSPMLSASAPMANSAVSSTQGLTGSTTQLALTPQSIDKFISLSQPTDEPITARTICLPEKKDIGTISLNDVDAFFQSLPSDTPASSVPSVPVVSASPISTSQVSEPSKEEIEEALKQIKEALQMPPVRFNCPGRIFPIEKALQTLSNLDESSGITIGQKADILSLTDKFETLPACVNKAIKARDNLAQMQTLKTTLDQNLKSSIAHFTVKKAETVETEQEIEDLKSKLKAAEKKKETLATEIKELYEGSLLDKKVVDMLNKEMPMYKEEAKAGEEKEKGVNQEWKNMMDLISNISANLKFD